MNQPEKSKCKFCEGKGYVTDILKTCRQCDGSGNFSWCEKCSVPSTESEKESLENLGLSELIKLCGEEFETLSRDSSTEKIVWICNNYLDETAPLEDFGKFYEGSTPEEAVRNLLKALKK